MYLMWVPTWLATQGTFEIVFSTAFIISKVQIAQQWKKLKSAGEESTFETEWWIFTALGNCCVLWMESFVISCQVYLAVHSIRSTFQWNTWPMTIWDHFLHTAKYLNFAVLIFSCFDHYCFCFMFSHYHGFSSMLDLNQYVSLLNCYHLYIKPYK